MYRSFLFPLCFFLVMVVEASAKHICDLNECKQADPKYDMHFSYDNDFEDGTLDPWVEKSKHGVEWKVENKTSPWEPGNVAPPPLSGSNYLRVDRGSTLSFGVAVLRSETFKLAPNEYATFSFDFWIRSKWPQFTNLEVKKILCH